MGTVRKPRGMTLMEVVVAASIFSLAIALSFSTMNHASITVKNQVHEASLRDRSEKAIRTMQDGLADATQVGIRHVTDGSYVYLNAEIRFQVPIRFKNTSLTANNGQKAGLPVTFTSPPKQVVENPSPPTFNDDYDFFISYGWRDFARFVENADDPGRVVALQGPGLRPTSGSVLPDGLVLLLGRTPRGYCRFRFQRDPSIRIGKFGKDGMIDEAAEGVDLDSDGQKTSKFAVGYLEFSCCIGSTTDIVAVPIAGTIMPISASCVLQRLNDTATVTTASEASQLKTSRIFFNNSGISSRIDVAFWMVHLDSNDQPHLCKSVITDFLRNNASYVTSASATAVN
ncbi:MAG TPA: prepilin-type N-terminal cleavage/methylation domain-containing protein [Planctomycetota bacterium]|nr:prepilin-type N-terminal cleavage/methylation domain-containing protein [Planctomycetota bacterium]